MAHAIGERSRKNGEAKYRAAVHLISYLSPGIPTSLFEVLTEIIGADLELVETSSGPLPGEDPFRDGHADLGWMCSTSFAELGDPAGDPSVALVGIAWVPDDPDSAGQPVYFGDLVVPADSTAQSLDDLAGKRIGCNDPVSLSGFHSLRIETQRRGHVFASFAELAFTGGHNRSLDLLIAGDEIDAAVVDSVCRTRRARDDEAVANLRIIERLGPWPTQPLVARATMDSSEVERVQAAVLAANDDPRVQAELAAAAMVRLVSVDPNHYRSVREAMRS